jgi:hypothetical protein
MTDFIPRETLQALIAKWNAYGLVSYRDCASELEALLSLPVAALFVASKGSFIPVSQTSSRRPTNP